MPDHHPVDPSEIRRLRDAHPRLPDAYWRFLAEVGWGETAGIWFYSGPTTLAAMGLTEGPTGYVAVGDDQAGFFYGFLPERGETVMGLDSHGWVLEDLGASLPALLRELAEDDG